jgi:hypothetical protein
VNATSRYDAMKPGCVTIKGFADLDRIDEH